MKIKDLKNKKGVFNILVIGIVLLILINSGMIVNCSSDYITHFGLDGLFSDYNYQYIDGLVVKLPLNTDDYRNSSIYDSNYSERMVGMVSLSSIDSYIWNHQDIDSDYFIRALKNNIPDDIDNFTNFTIVQNVASDSNVFSVYLYNGDIVSFGSFAFVSADGSPLILKKYDFNGTDYVLDNNYTMDGTGNSYLALGQSFINVVYSNSGILISDTYYANFYDGLSYYETNPENFKDQNYLLYDSNGNNIYDNPTIQPDVYPDGSGGTSANNLYLDGAQISFDCPNYWGVGQHPNVIPEQPTYNWGRGSARFQADLNQFQINNLSEFNLDYIFQIKMSGTCTALYQDDLNFYGSFGPYTVTQSLADFYNHGSLKSFNMSDLFENCHNVYPGAFNLNDTVYDAINVIDNYEEINNFQWQIQVTVKLESNEEYSGACKSSYDFINKTMTTYDTSIHNNDNPYVDDDGLPTNSTDDNTTSSSSSGGNTLINNDNDTVNFNGNGEVAQELVEDLLPEDSNAGLTQDLKDTLNQNGWLSVVQAVFSFVPIGVWSTIEIYVVSCLGILAAFFVLRLVLDLL